METRKTAAQYEDIIRLPHHQSGTHPRMSAGERAAQFSPFAALTGYEEAVKETARLTEAKVELSQDAKQRLNEKLSQIISGTEKHPGVCVTYFTADENKAGGSYVTKSGRIKAVSKWEEMLVLADQTKIPLDDIVEIEYVSGLK